MAEVMLELSEEFDDEEALWEQAFEEGVKQAEEEIYKDWEEEEI